MKHHAGSIEVITGSMFCGKTEELIRRLRRASIARQKVQVFKPIIDNRYAEEKVTSHSGHNFAAFPIRSASEILKRLDHEAFYSHILTVKVDGKSSNTILRDMQRHPAKPVITHTHIKVGFQVGVRGSSGIIRKPDPV